MSSFSSEYFWLTTFRNSRNERKSCFLLQDVISSQTQLRRGYTSKSTRSKKDFMKSKDSFEKRDRKRELTKCDHSNLDK